MAKIITIDNKEWDIKVKANSGSLSNDFGTSSYRYPDFVGSKLYHNSTSSDKYSLEFTIHESKLINFKESIKKIADPNNLITHPTYGKLEHIIVELDTFGAISGNILGTITYHTSKQGDIRVTCTFQEHTSETPLEKKDLETENEEAFEEVETETSDFDVDLSTQDKRHLSDFAGKLEDLYSDIQNSEVVSAFNTINSELTQATLNSQRIINAFKGILGLPNKIYTDTRLRLSLLQSQSNLIMDVPFNSANLVLFNTKCIAYNTGLSSRSVFISESALEAASGLKSVPLT